MAIASPGAAPYHQAAAHTEVVLARHVSEVRGTRPATGSRRISKGRSPCQTDAPVSSRFSLTSTHFASITGIDSMRIRTLATTVAVCLLALSALRAATPQMPISEVRPGMVGIGRTVFNGTRVEEFRANILGVIENVIGPR